MSTTPLTDAINALTTYANETTGASDTTLSDAVGTLVAGYGGGGSGWTTDGMASGTEPSGALVITASTIIENAFGRRPNITSVRASSTTVGPSAFYTCNNLETVVLTGITSTLGQQAASYCAKLSKVDVSTPEQFINNCLRNDPLLTELIIRKASVVPLQNVGAFASTPFASGGTGGTLYVPNALISSYQSANNWSTILGYASNSIQAIEGSYYETHYADGTPIE